MAQEIQFAYWETSAHEQWKKIMRCALGSSTRFEIHCWKEEQREIEMALGYGTLQKTDWEYGVVIAGAVTPQWIEFLLALPKPGNVETENKMTPFFSIFLDNGFSSEHYGTELYQA
ncbi:MAG: hypothetical protein ACOX7F_01540 [Eubacteriales bacterium]|jgi:hypothetical protein